MAIDPTSADMDSPRRTRNRVACRRCQRRKIRCDGNLPSCGSCLKAGVTCVNDGKQEVHRLYMANMENRMRWLESLVRENCPNVDLASENDTSALNEKVQAGGPRNQIDVDSGFAQSPPPERVEQDAVPGRQAQDCPVPESSQPPNDEPQQEHEIGLVSLSSGGDPRYIGPSSGYFFASRIFSNAGRRNNGKARMTNTPNLSAELLEIPASLPPRKETTMELSARYFRTFHLVYPFLHEPSHTKTIERMYASQEENPSDIFHVFMVMAIAALDLSRQCKFRLPVEGYFTTAMEHFDNICGDTSMSGLQSLLLLMVYALHNPSCSLNIWNLNYQCLASVIDLGLQRDIRASPSFRISMLDQEMRTRIFWVAYTFDRVICTMMGRPIGLRDEACDLRFPLDVADSDLIDTNSTWQGQPHSSQPSVLSHSIHLFRLAQMNSEIKYIMHSVTRDTPAYAYPPVRNISTWQQDMIHSLQNWLSRIPQNENSSMVELCKIRYHETMVLLLRPSPGIPVPSDQSLDLCFDQAVKILRGFGNLYRSGELLYSRLVVHSVLLGTLVMLYCIWKVPATATKCRVDELARDFNTSQNILSSIGEYWAESNRARDCIDELSSLTLQRLSRSESPATLRSSITMNSMCPCPNHGQAASQFVHTQDSQEDLQRHDDLGALRNPNSHLQSNQWQVENGRGSSEFVNMFDDFLQGDFHGWSSMPGIDGLMSEFFH